MFSKWRSILRDRNAPLMHSRNYEISSLVRKRDEQEAQTGNLCSSNEIPFVRRNDVRSRVSGQLDKLLSVVFEPLCRFFPVKLRNGDVYQKNRRTSRQTLSLGNAIVLKYWRTCHFSSYDASVFRLRKLAKFSLTNNAIYKPSNYFCSNPV